VTADRKEAAMSDGERFSRAGSYVLGLMDEQARERAERDLEVDPAFRDAVFKVAERMHKFEVPTRGEVSDQWKYIASRISEMPQMRAVAGEPAAKPQVRQTTPVWQGLQAVPTLRAAIYAVSLIVAFAAGYFAALARM
jgi:anti-sigma-K factor RskA